MSRQDIADYLGLTIETVSRTLTSLESAATIEVPTSRRIVLRNRARAEPAERLGSPAHSRSVGAIEDWEKRGHASP